MKIKYPSDLSDKEWAIFVKYVPAAKSGGRRRTTDIREVVNGILYLLRSGCSWRMLPREYPPWKTVYRYLSEWKKDGTWKKIHDILHQEIRRKSGRNPEASAGIIDSQSVKTTEKGGSKDTMQGRK